MNKLRDVSLRCRVSSNVQSDTKYVHVVGKYSRGANNYFILCKCSL